LTNKQYLCYTFCCCDR